MGDTSPLPGRERVADIGLLDRAVVDDLHSLRVHGDSIAAGIRRDQLKNAAAARPRPSAKSPCSMDFGIGSTIRNFAARLPTSGHALRPVGRRARFLWLRLDHARSARRSRGIRKNGFRQVFVEIHGLFLSPPAFPAVRVPDGSSSCSWSCLKWATSEAISSSVNRPAIICITGLGRRFSL